MRMPSRQRAENVGFSARFLFVVAPVAYALVAYAPVAYAPVA